MLFIEIGKGVTDTMTAMAGGISVTISAGNGTEVILATRQDLWDAQAANVRMLTAVQATPREMREILQQHTAALAEHATVLNQHTAILEHHSTTLDQHTAALNEQRQFLRSLLSDTKQIKDHFGIG